MNEGIQMMRRMFRFSAVLLCIGLATSILTGCFGASEDTVNTTVPVPVTSSDVAATTLSVPTTEASTLVDGLPRQYAEALTLRPIVLVFYAPGGVDDEKVLSAVRELQTTYSSYTFLMYDYRMPAAYGDLTKEIKANYNLDVGYLPSTFLIRRDGTAATKWSGYVDKGTLNQALINLGRL
jgi:hypothetical protein